MASAPYSEAMMIRYTRTILALCSAVLAARAPVGAQAPSGRLREVLPSDVADRVIARIVDARAHDLPGQALENRALKFAAKGVAPAEIERSVVQQADRMVKVKDVLARARGTKPLDDEIEAGAEALRQGLDEKALTALAKSAPAGRSLAVPLYVIGSLVNRGLAADAALERVEQRLNARASDAELEQLPAQAIAGQANRPADVGRDMAATKSGGRAAGGPPPGVPANGGGRARPSNPGVQRKHP
jgi:hypothetical protein